MADCQGHNEHRGEVRNYTIRVRQPTKRDPERVRVIIDSYRLCERCAEVNRRWGFLLETLPERP